MMGVRLLVTFIIAMRSVQGRKICIEIDDDKTKKPPPQPIPPMDDSIGVSDMILSKDQYDALFSNNALKRHGLTKTFRHWPNATVPVKFDEIFDEEFQEKVKSAMKHIMDRSCIVFDWENEPTSNYVYITRAIKCASNVGNMRVGRQNVYLYEKCSKGNIIHELLHALGFLHMHTAVERDEYVDINWNNIMEKSKLNFQKYTSHVSMFGTKYDYDSIMHYNAKSFAKDRSQETIIKKRSGGEEKMGQRRGMSKGDIQRLNRMYKCPIKTPKMTLESTKAEMIIEDEVDDDISYDENELNDE